MKLSHVSRVCVSLVSVVLCMSASATQTDVKTEASQAAASAVTKVAPKVTPGKVLPKGTTAAGTIQVKGGENQYPTGTIPVPPKPKKEGLEAAGAVKAKAAQP